MASMNNQYFQRALRCHDPLHVTVEKVKPYALGNGADQLASSAAKVGCITTLWLQRMVTMYCLHYSKAQPREDQLRKLVAIALSKTKSLARQI